MHNHKKPKWTTDKCTKSVHGEERPFFESRAQNLKSRFKQLYNLPKFDLGVAGHLNPVTYNHKLAKRLIKKYVNQNVNAAYSEYCKKCRPEYKDSFYNCFEEDCEILTGSRRDLKYKLVDGIIRHK